VKVRGRIASGILISLFFVLGMPALGQQYYQASIGSGTHYISYYLDGQDCNGPQYVSGNFAVTWGTLTLRQGLPLKLTNGRWVPAVVSEYDTSSLGPPSRCLRRYSVRTER